MVEEVFRRAPRLPQFARALLADAGHARNVVRRVAPQREDVAHEHGIGNAVLGLDGRTVHHLDTVALLLVDAAAVVHQLPVILVGRDHVDLIPGRGALLGKGADHIVGLVPGDFEHRNAHGVEHPLHVGHRQQDVLGRLRAVGLVFGVDRAAERAAFGVERHAQQVGMLALLDVAQELREAEHHRGVHPGAVAHGTPHEGIIILEHQRIGVDKKQFFHLREKRGACGRLRVTARRDCPRRTTRHRRSPSRRAAGHGASPRRADAARCARRSRKAGSRTWAASRRARYWRNGSRAPPRAAPYAPCGAARAHGRAAPRSARSRCASARRNPPPCPVWGPPRIPKAAPSR